MSVWHSDHSVEKPKNHVYRIVELDHATMGRRHVADIFYDMEDAWREVIKSLESNMNTERYRNFNTGGFRHTYQVQEVIDERVKKTSTFTVPEIRSAAAAYEEQDIRDWAKDEGYDEYGDNDSFSDDNDF